MSRPNLLFVYADQMRGMDMGCAGNKQVRTPTLDRLAEEGVRCTHAFSNIPVCGPARASLLTGRFPLEHGVLVNDLPLPETTPSIGKVLRAAGYRTGYIGKWHLDGVPRNKWTPPGPRRHGFEEWAAYNCSHQYFNARYYTDSPRPIEVDGYEPVAQTDLAIEFLRKADDRPFALFLSWGPPHDPYDQVPDEFRALYDPEAIELRPNVPDELPETARIRGKKVEDPRRVVADYYAAITALDAQMARLLEALDEFDLAGNTLVIFTSDHGDMLFSQGKMKKQQPWEESISIPFLARLPNVIPAGATCDVLLGIVDMAPTVLGLLGVPPLPGATGNDLSWALRGEQGVAPEALFLMNIVAADEGLRQGIPEWRGLRTGRYTYARTRAGDWLLYDNVTDPYQLHNLIGSPDHAALHNRLSAQLDRLLQERGDDFLPGFEHLQRAGLTALWNARERVMHGDRGRFIAVPDESGSV